MRAIRPRERIAETKRAPHRVDGTYFVSLLNASRWCSVLRKSIPSAIAGVARHVSPTGLMASNSYFGPAFTTRTPLSSPVK